MKNIADVLKSAGITDLLINEPLSKHCTFQIGGPADILVYPRNHEELRSLLSIVSKYQLPLQFLGKGSNLLICDEGLRGVTIKLSKHFDQFEVRGAKVTVDAGYSLIRLAAQLAKKGLGGLEFAGGIPGTIGGAIRMNAGAHGSDMSKIVSSVLVMTDTGEMLNIHKDDLNFSYRHSILDEKPWLVLQASLDLNLSEPSLISNQMKSWKEKRLSSQPLKEASCGSVFKNPLPQYAGDLIERCGLKGYRIGNAQFSSMHANFIINAGDASARDVLSLIQTAQRRVFEQFGIHLTPEVKYVGMEMERS